MIRGNRKTVRTSRGRRGAVLVVVAVCLALAGVLLLAVTRQAALTRRSTQSSQRRLQAQWLAEAGVERAVARLAADRAYTGETWSIATHALDGQHDAEVRIKTQPVAGRAGRSAVHVEADYPRIAELRCRWTKQIEVDREPIASPPAAKSAQ
jgi:Tfp pilus assembly protein PilX